MRCWPGCLAIIIKAVFPENIGIVCQVIRFDSSMQKWDIEIPHKAKTLPWSYANAAKLDERHILHSNKACLPDDWLLPISGPLVEDEQDETQVLRIREPV